MGGFDLVKENYPKILYHYCSIEAFKSIIENQEIWLTNPIHSNDSTEHNWMYNSMIKLLDDFITKKSEAEFMALLVCSIEPIKKMDQQKLLDHIKNHLDQDTITTLKEVIKGLPETTNLIKSYSKNYMSYITCFTKKGDDLNQWRGYTENGNGLCLGFKYDKLSEVINKSKYNNRNYSFIDILPIIYDTPQERKYIFYKIFIPAIRHLFDYFGSKDKDIYPDNLKSILTDLSFLAFRFKHNSFRSEAEWRIILFSKSSKKSNLNLNLRCLRNGLSTYIPYKINIHNCLSHIIIGPSMKDISDELSLYCKDILKMNKKIKISNSKIPYIIK